MISKSKYDMKEYRHITLQNGLDCVLCHDATTMLSSCCVSVDAGCMDDGQYGVQGLAHLLEHMLIMNSEQYPEPGDFKTFVRRCSGSSNASTSLGRTRYHMEVPSQFLTEGLKRIAAFMSAPLLDAAHIEQEIAAVDSEHKKNVQSDSRRLLNLRRQCAYKGHPFNTFSTGSEETLLADGGATVQQLAGQLREFYNRHYSAHRMKLTVLSNIPLDQLESVTRATFCEIGARREMAPIDIPANPIILENATCTLYKVQPVAKVTELHLTWSLPEAWSDYTRPTTSLLALYLGHEAEGSLLSLLRKRRYASTLVCGRLDGTKSFLLFGVKITLTSLEHYEATVALVIQYLALLKQTSMKEHERAFQEHKLLEQNSFVFEEERKGYSVVRDINERMIKGFKVDHLLNEGCFSLEFDPQTFAKYLDLLTLSNSIVWLLGPLEELSIEGDIVEVDPNYGTRFIRSKIPLDLLQNSTAIDSDLRMPNPNPFITTDFSLASLEETSEVPTLVHSQDRFSIWWQLDPVFAQMPLAAFHVDIRSPVAYKSPRHAVLTSLYVSMLDDFLGENLTYYALLADFSVRISSSARGISLVVKGLKQKLPSLLTDILKVAAKGAVRWEQFSVIKEKQRLKYANYHTKTTPFRQAMYYGKVVCEVPRWSMQMYAEEIENVTVEELRQHIDSFLTSFSMALLFSGISKANALSLGRSCASHLLGAHLCDNASPDYICTRSIELPGGISTFSKLATNRNEENTGLVYSVDVGPWSVENSVLGQLFKNIISGVLSKQLRFEKKLGYVVLSGHSSEYNSVRYYIVIQSAHSVEYVDSVVEQFIKEEIPKFLNDESAFRDAVESLIQKKKEPFKNVYQASNFFWHELTRGQCRFTMAKDEVKFLESKELSLNALRQFYMSNFVAQARMVKIRILSGGVAADDGGILLSDREQINAWKSLQRVREQLVAKY